MPGVLSCLNRVKRGGTDSTRSLPYEQFVVDAWVADRSGSMVNMKDASRDGMTEFIKVHEDMSAQGSNVYVIICTFDSETEFPYCGWVSDMTDEDVKKCLNSTKPRGMTKLYDSALKTLSEMKKKLKDIERRIKDDKSLSGLGLKVSSSISIFTDGDDNKSTSLPTEMNEKIHDARDSGTTCIFMAANQDACEEGQRLGFSAGTSMSVTADNTHGGNAFHAANNLMRRASSGVPGISPSFSQLERQTSQGASPFQTVTRRSRLTIPRLTRQPAVQAVYPYTDDESPPPALVQSPYIGYIPPIRRSETGQTTGQTLASTQEIFTPPQLPDSDDDLDEID